MSTLLDTPLTQLLGCRYPIVQTAMGWIADAKLTAATSNAGGFGFLAAAVMSTAEFDAAIAKLRELTPHRFGVNFHMFQPNAAEIIERVIANADRVRAVSYGRGPDAKTIKRLKDAGVLCMPTVGALKHAQKAVELGADLITVQGAEGGGHTGSVPTTLLLPQVLDAVKIPVVAAGGFHSGRGLAGALAFGAAGIAMGTRFLMTAESPVPRETLAKYLAVKEPANIRASTAMDGLPQRMIDNPYLLRLESGGLLHRLLVALSSAWQWRAHTGMTVGHMLRTFFAALREGDSAIQTLMSANAPVIIQRAMVQGRPDEGVLPSGQVAAVIDSLPAVDALIQAIVREAERQLEAVTRRSPDEVRDAPAQKIANAPDFVRATEAS
ncbi:nitronate monooxygenase [Panacagrimonas perspica]|uniref:Nitronate monooxygenase n=1 Tax=Panacagrimonas perspica TaxID=381431 RepID=A0A4R7PAP6_9GAMM|nr:nitronate monooxygenase [Panacagrimonas perspica]TDU31133.1 nitronate monooxygenase [Panacagrimonas perspica]THD01734.1 2-nitropropane dioxygenase [Panacagrimonas perspica]